MDNIIYKKLSYEIIGIAMEVHNRLGSGFLEKVYENAMIILLNKKGVKSKAQFPIKIEFENQIIGDYIVDIFVENQIILELKSVNKIHEKHKSQIINYLKATNKQLGIIINFGNDRLEYERIINTRYIQ